MRLLFIGNSHTYRNNLPQLVAQKFQNSGEPCTVTMLAHPGWRLSQHENEPEVLFNIRYGHYDFVILQEHAHPFDQLDQFYKSVAQISAWIKEAGSVPVLYETWARKSEPGVQDEMNIAHQKAATENNCILARVGENWWSYMKSHPRLEMYDTDGAHASAEGSDFAADVIFKTIRAVPVP